MSLPYMPFYVSDFEADTSHLSLAEDGAYNRLLRLCWRTSGCSIPDDNQWIMRRLRVDEQTYFEIVRPVIDEFFKTKKARLFSPRLSEIFRESKTTHKKRSEAGKKGGRPRKPLKRMKTDESPEKAGIKPGQSNQNQNQSNPPTVPPGDELDRAVEAWNEMATKHDLPTANLIEKRRPKLKARLQEVGGIDGWREAVALVPTSGFLLHGSKDRDWKANIDWLLKPDSITRMREGDFGCGLAAPEDAEFQKLYAPGGSW